MNEHTRPSAHRPGAIRCEAARHSGHRRNPSHAESV